MAALLLALMLTLVLDQGAASQRGVAALADSGRVGAGRMGALGLMVLFNAILAAALGGVMAALLMPDARLLFLAIALSFGGLGQIAGAIGRGSPAKIPSAPVGVRALLGLTLRRAGENGAFATAGVVAFTDAPVLAALGATFGGWAALVPTLLLGSRYTRHRLLRLFQLLAGGILLVAAILCATSALRIL